MSAPDGTRAEEAYDSWLKLFANRNEVAEEYARCIRRQGPVWDGYQPINQAILRRWSLAGLRYIKERAWKIVRKDISEGAA